MKHLKYFFVLALGVGGVAAFAMAMPSPRRESNPEVQSLTEPKRDYLKKAASQLQLFEKQLAEMRREGTAFRSIQSYMLTDDLDLQLKDVHGDLLKLQSSQAEDWEKFRVPLENRMDEIRQSLVKLTDDKTTPLAVAEPGRQD